MIVGNPEPLLAVSAGGNSDNDEEQRGRSEDDGDDDSLMVVDVVPLLEFPGQIPVKKLEAPPEGMSWKETAILECIDLALKSHDHCNPQDFVWKSPLHDDFTGVKGWVPKRLSLPVWAVDPWSEMLAPDGTNNIESSEEDKAAAKNEG